MTEDENIQAQVSGGDAVVFKKKARRGCIRRKDKSSGDDEPDEPAADIRTAIEETKLEQKLRNGRSGVDVDKLAKVFDPLKKKEVENFVEPTPASMLDSQFSTEDQGEPELGLLDKQMKRYIDERLKGATEPEEGEAKKLTPEDELYMIPEEFRVKSKTRHLGDAAETWLTGIVEVELPMEEKLKNIDETEKAKKRMLEERMKGVTKSSFVVDTSSEKGYMRVEGEMRKGKKIMAKQNIPLISKEADAVGGVGNFNANYIRRTVKDEGRAAASSEMKRPDVSSDDVVMERFKKRLKHR
eukprot:747852-Hanusia_phi.AAC.3